MNIKRILYMILAATLLLGCSTAMTGCSSEYGNQVIIYSNADDEAVEAMKSALDANGYEGKYVFQSFGTSELGGKILAEGTDIEADIITMSSYYIESAQAKHQMFQNLNFTVNTAVAYPNYYAPILANQGAIIINTQMMAEKNLDAPVSIKDLADPQYAGYLSMIDIQGSSTAWLMIQALVSEYGEDDAQEILTSIYKNAGAHMEQSGSGPIKKIRSGEVAIGFGLRHQAVADKKAGLPVDYIDPIEGNFTLTESLAVVNKGDKTNELAIKMAQCIIENGRDGLMEHYPVPLYEGETVDFSAISANPKVFAEPLTVELLEKHRILSETCKSSNK